LGTVAKVDCGMAGHGRLEHPEVNTVMTQCGILIEENQFGTILMFSRHKVEKCVTMPGGLTYLWAHS
jgi:hypothetical protein